MKRRKFIKGSAIVGASLTNPMLAKANSGMFENSGEKNYRKVFRVLNADRTKVGTLPILRAFAGDHLDHVSPYVLFDEFGPVDVAAGSDPLRVDAHPHAGVAPTTYFLEGSGHHKDSLDFDFQVSKGEFMIFSSGRGAIHMEESGKQLVDEGGSYHGFQIWLNTPTKYKFLEPTTHVHRDNEIPVIDEKDFQAHVVLGELFKAKSKVVTHAPAFYYHIKIKPDGRLDIPTDPTHNVFIYGIKGALEIENRRLLAANQIALYERGESLVNLYSKEGAEVLVLGGAPLNETVYSYGPFVMNTEAEIRQCIADYNSGKMGNPELVNQ